MRDARMIFGFALLIAIAALAFVIAIAKVTQETSYGLIDVLGILGVLAGQFCNWAFGHYDKENK